MSEEKPFLVHDVHWSDETIGNLWRTFAEDHDKAEAYFGHTLGGHLLRFVGRHVPLAGRTVLDYGSGPGYLLEHIEALGLEVRYTAWDASEASIEQLKARHGGHRSLTAAHAGSRIPTGVGEPFDVLLCSEVIEHLDDGQLAEAGRQFSRLLAPGGRICLSTPHDENLTRSKHVCPECGCRFHQYQHVRSWTVESLERFMTAQGFRRDFCVATLLGPWSSRAKNHLRSWLAMPVQWPHLIYVGTRVND